MSGLILNSNTIIFSFFTENDSEKQGIEALCLKSHTQLSRDPALLGRQPRCFTAPCRVVREKQLGARVAAEKANVSNASYVLTTNTPFS